MNFKKILLATLVIWIIGSVFGFLTCGWLFNWVYMIPPIIWKDAAAMMTISNMVFSYLFGLIASFLFVWVYAFLFKGIPGKGVKKGMIYGILIWLVGALSGMATMPFYMTISMVVVIYWIIQALILNIIRGAIIGVLYKGK